jgi:tRNA pseudouridine38-40 synthase
MQSPTQTLHTVLCARARKSFARSMKIQRYLATIEYVGSRFNGWQIQAADLQHSRQVQQSDRGARAISGLQTVAGALEDAINRSNAGSLVGHIQGSGRTDTGVHALGQVAHFDFEATRAEAFSGTEMRSMMNACLKRSVREHIRVRRCVQADSDFHVLSRCTAREYVYRLLWTDCDSGCSQVFDSATSWLVKRRLDVARMQEAVGELRGEHNFAAFQTVGCTATTPVRTLDAVLVEGDLRAPSSMRWPSESVAWPHTGEMRATQQYIEIHFRQRSFLYRQVRNMVGLLVAVGLHKRTLDDVRRLVREQQRQSAPFDTAEPHGLYFARALFSNDSALTI